MSAATAVPIRPLPRGSLVKLWIGLAALLLAAAGLAWWGTAGFQTITLPSGVRYRVVQAGTGPAVTPADAVALRYKLHVNRLDAPVIQDSDESGGPFVTTIGELFPGFGEGLQKMQAGGRYQLWLPPGTHISGPIPPSAPFRAGDTLVFEIQILQIGAGQAQALQMQRLQQMMNQQAPPGGGDPHGGGGAPPAGGGAPPAGGR